MPGSMGTPARHPWRLAVALGGALLAGAAGTAVAQTRSPAQEAGLIRAAFLHAWDGYVQYAWGHDQLRPLTRGYRDWYPASLEMTPLDGFDTMLLMGLKAQAARARHLILDSLSFDRDFPVQVFEVTIRELGGINDLTLGEARSRIQDFVQVGQAEVLAVNLDDLWLGCHEYVRL